MRRLVLFGIRQTFILIGPISLLCITILQFFAIDTKTHSFLSIYKREKNVNGDLRIKYTRTSYLQANQV